MCLPHAWSPYIHPALGVHPVRGPSQVASPSCCSTLQPETFCLCMPPPPSYCYSSPPETAGVGGALFAPGADCPGYPEAGREGLALNMLTWEKGIQLKSRGMISYWHAPFVSFRKKWEMLLCQRRVKLRRDMKSHVF